MTQTASNYGTVLYELGIERAVIEETARIFALTPELLRELTNPTVAKTAKRQVIRKIFPEEIQNFLCVVSDYQVMDQMTDILTAYENRFREAQRVTEAELLYVTKPTEEQKNGICAYIKKKFQSETVNLTLTEDPSLVGGFVIKVGDIEIDRSLRGRIHELQQRLVWR